MAKEVPGGYNGKILRVNLSTQSIAAEAIDDELYRKYLGGAGFATYFLWREVPPKADPLGPRNKLIFALGPIAGLLLPGCDRNSVGAKSPLTGGIAKSEAGGFWAAELKRAGYDIIIIEGKAAKPVYLWIKDGEASLRDAGHLWGKTTKETQELVRSELGDERIRVAQIGPAGENLVRYACIMNGLYDTAGRGGLGAVMGSKGLKAVAVRGHKLPRIVNAEGVKRLREWLFANRQLISRVQELGSGAPMSAMEVTGNLPVRNFQDGLFPQVKTIDPQAVKATIRIGMEGCFACPVRCKKVVKVDEPYQVDPAYGGPEYETLAALGSNCGIGNLKAIAKGNELCNAYALDTISTGGTIAFAMECFEKGLLTTRDTDGIELKFGNDEAMLKVIELIAFRRGIGNFLAEGSAKMAQKIGRGSEKFAMQVKGLESGMHEPRDRKPGLGLGYMVSPFGADHNANMMDTAYAESSWRAKELEPLGLVGPFPAEDIGPRKVAVFKAGQLRNIVTDSVPVCWWLPYSLQQIAEVVSAVTGWNSGATELLTIAERTMTTARLFNAREGFTADDDKLPERFFQPKTDGILADKALDAVKLEQARRYYYTLMGWDKQTGIPTPEKLEELGIT